jgi:hypothetical protein
MEFSLVWVPKQKKMQEHGNTAAITRTTFAGGITYEKHRPSFFSL